ncbi:MAG: type II secretion system protein [Lactobacillales bacterium]|jgi:hypothetical protein|nr:type II secretion system protein [Lactobacillales bacterium]
MRDFIEDEQGVTLVELLGTVAIMGVVLVLFSSVLYLISKANEKQMMKVEMQQIANRMYLQMEKISRTPNIVEKAGYLGKYAGGDGATDVTPWNEAFIVKVNKESDKGSGGKIFSELHLNDEGSNEIALTDITDTSNNACKSYSFKRDKNMKIKVIQQKNKNEVTNTNYETPNYRDIFTVQNSVFILFYKESINFGQADYYDSAGAMDIGKLKQENQDKIKYIRKFELTYRDESKSEGGVPGDGRW